MFRLKRSKPLHFISFEKIKSATQNFDESKNFIGEGGYGRVYKGDLIISPNCQTSIPVAIKRLNEQFGQGLKEFLTEIDLLSDQKHPNLVDFLGYCNEGVEKIIVYKYAKHGSLEKFLSRGNTTRTLTWLERLKICVGAARGLEHLHNRVGKHQAIIHRDIKSANILIDENWVAKVSDFGLSKLSFTGVNRSYVVSQPCGTAGYIEPEYIKTGIVTKESDVYSFGIVLIEVLCGRFCTEDYYLKFLNGSFDEIVDPSLKEDMKSDSMNKFAEIAYGCLHVDRKKRPPMGDVVKELEESFKLQIRVEKAKRIFQQFRLNKDGDLNKEEVEALLVATNTGLNQCSDEVFRLYDMFIKGDKRLACDGLLQIYDKGYGDLDLDYEVLGREVKIDNGKENALISKWERYEKVWKVFQEFNSNNDDDGGLSKKEFAALIVATYPKEENHPYLDFFKLYERYINREKGLVFNDLLHIYDQGKLDLDFDYHAALIGQKRYEKVWKIFQVFDSNNDNKLNTEELVALIVATYPKEENRPSLDFFKLYEGDIDGEKGLAFNSLLRIYGQGKLDVDSGYLAALRQRKRYEMVRKIFQEFNSSNDDSLCIEELAALIVATYPKEENCPSLDFFKFYEGYFDEEKGLAFDGLLRIYDQGKLNLDLGYRAALRRRKRYEKVWKIFQEFDLNNDGALSNEELAALIVATYPNNEENRPSLDLFKLNERYIDGEKGLAFNGLLRIYDEGKLDLDLGYHAALRQQKRNLVGAHWWLIAFLVAWVLLYIMLDLQWHKILRYLQPEFCKFDYVEYYIMPIPMSDSEVIYETVRWLFTKFGGLLSVLGSSV